MRQVWRKSLTPTEKQISSRADICWNIVTIRSTGFAGYDNCYLPTACSLSRFLTAVNFSPRAIIRLYGKSTSAISLKTHFVCSQRGLGTRLSTFIAILAIWKMRWSPCSDRLRGKLERILPKHPRRSPIYFDLTFLACNRPEISCDRRSRLRRDLPATASHYSALGIRP